MKEILCPRCKSSRVLENNPLDTGYWSGTKKYTCVNCLCTFEAIVNENPVEADRITEGKCKGEICLL